jgi:hypothetical protein
LTLPEGSPNTNSPAEARNRPSGVNATADTLASWLVNVRIMAPSAVRQSLTVLSCAAVATIRPSGDTATCWTPSTPPPVQEIAGGPLVVAPAAGAGATIRARAANALSPALLRSCFMIAPNPFARGTNADGDHVATWPSRVGQAVG